jgi:hypothetical protein
VLSPEEVVSGRNLRVKNPRHPTWMVRCRAQYRKNQPIR